jgi:hypothetical protein
MAKDAVERVPHNECQIQGEQDYIYGRKHQKAFQSSPHNFLARQPQHPGWRRL